MNQVELPWPSRTLSPNGRAHWRTVAKAKKIARAYGFAVIKEAKIGIAAGDVPIMIALRFHPKTRNLPDADNAVASMKAYLDGIADALGVNDNAFRLAAPTIAEPVKGGKVIVTIGNHNVEESRENALGQPPVIHKGRDIAFPESGGA